MLFKILFCFCEFVPVQKKILKQKYMYLPLVAGDTSQTFFLNVPLLPASNTQVEVLHLYLH